ncbi:hypothetical protein [Niallia endozanthoxylica]|uniref:Uncharacterized protein n=1 Tax=Niallia endozanthoxylica TaxID=2036016 RepID=A0A5J5H1U4_9BACI|nr:hypothetical protein [Niallia endozanthoxylica]KAA9014539.1 hypothetical protein F4V44_23630 [Niallia endozanthoxylica]
MTNNSKKDLQMESVVLYLISSMLIPFAVLNYFNVYIWNMSFNPVDFVLKPLILAPVASLLLALLTEWGIYACNYVKRLSLTIKKQNGRFSLKVVEKSLPIHVINQSYLNEVQIKNSTIVDMRIKDQDSLSFDPSIEVIKLFNHNQQVNIHYLLENANLLIQSNALKNKPITFIVDSKKERNRTISKIWLKLILNPNSKSAKDDIHTIKRLVY